MKRIFTLILFLFFSYTTYSQDVMWDRNKKLNFADFKYTIATKPQEPGVIAETEFLGDFENSASAQINLKYSIDISFRSYLTYRVFAMFDQYQSFMLDKSDTMVLKHEQGHFDICELYARKMRQYLIDNAYSAYTEDYFTKALDSIQASRHQYDSLYDIGTYEYNLQIKWSEKILRQIDSLNDYEETEKQIRLK